MAGRSVLFKNPSYVFGTDPYSAVTMVDGQLCFYGRPIKSGKLRKMIGPFDIWAYTGSSRTTWLVLDTRTGEFARVNRNNTLWVDLLQRLARIAAQSMRPVV